MSEYLKNKVVIITGASSGIGKALVLKYAGHGATIVMGARSLYEMKKISASIPGADQRVLVVQTDVSDENNCLRLIEKTMERFGRIDILINNAGISMRALFADMHLDVIRKLMDVNFWGTVYCTKYALPHLLKTNGSVVGVISVAGYIGLPGRTAYSASKFAVRGFLEALRTENLPNRLHVLVVAPGFTASNIRHAALTADGSAQGVSPRDETKMMTAEAVANHILKATQNRKNNLVLTFREGKLSVWLNKFFPNLVSRLAYRHMAGESDSPLKQDKDN